MLMAAKPEKIHDRRAAVSRRPDPVVDDIVDDPMPTYVGEKIQVKRAVRDDPLAGMHARKQIDDAMLAAGRRWQQHHENSEIGGVSAIDPTKEAVDGGRIPEPITDRQIKAIKGLKEAELCLGYQGTMLVEAVLGDRKTVPEYATKIGMTTEREFNYLSRRFRECLSELAMLWGLSNKKHSQQELDELAK